MRGRAKTVAAVLATLGLACATGPVLRDPNAQIAAARLAALPTQANVFYWGAKGRRISDSALTDTVRGNVDDSINYRLHLHGGHTFGSAATSRLDHFSEFFHWSARTMNEIMAERLGKGPATHRSVADWRFPDDLRSWRPVLNADFVLVSFIIYGERGRRSMDADVAGLTGSGSRAIACVVALEDGRVVWCNFIPNNSVKMQERPAAQSATDILLGDMLQLADRVPPDRGP